MIAHLKASAVVLAVALWFTCLVLTITANGTTLGYIAAFGYLFPIFLLIAIAACFLVARGYMTLVRRFEIPKGERTND